MNALISPGVRAAKFIIKGLDGRKSLEMLTSVSSYAEDEKGMEIKKVDNVLPMGFAFRRSVYDNKIANINPLTISDMLSDTLVINNYSKNNENAVYIDSTEVDVKNRDIDIPCRISLDGISWKDNRLKVEKKGRIICSPDLSSLEKNHKYEIYVLLKHFDYNDDALETNIAITGKSIQLKGINTPYKVDSDDYLVKLNRDGDFDINFPDAGNFTLENVSIKALDVTDYDKRFKALSKETLKNTDIGADQIRGTFDASQDEYLFFSIPYSEGWKCKIDGQDTKVLRADYAFSAIPVKKGNHNVEMYYEPPYWVPMIVMLVIGWMSFALGLIYKKKLKDNDA